MLGQSIFAFASLLAFVTYFVCLTALHFLPTGHNPLYNTISDYSVGSFSRLARVSTAVNVVGIFLLLVALVKTAGLPPVANTGLVWLGILALTRLGMVFIVTDVSAQKVTPRGVAHMILAALSFVAGVSAVTTLTRNLSSFGAWNAVYPALRFLAEISTPLLVIVLLTVLLPQLRRILGLTERLFLLTINAWLLISSGLACAYVVGLVR